MTDPRRFSGDWDDDDLDVAIATGQVDIDRWDLRHDERLDDQDRRAERESVPFYVVANDEARRERQDETRVRTVLRPRTGNVAVQPLRPVCTCGAAERGMRLPGPAHRYSCALHSKRLESEAA